MPRRAERHWGWNRTQPLTAKRLLREVLAIIRSYLSLAAVLSTLVAGASAAAAANRTFGVLEHLTCTDDVLTLPLPHAGDPVQLLSEQEGAWLEVVEQGQQVELSGATDPAIDITQPLRFGWHWARVPASRELFVRRVEANNSPGTYNLTLHCIHPEGWDKQLAWLQEASAISSRVAFPEKPAVLPQLLEELDRLTETSFDAEARAIALHVKAQTISVNGHSLEGAAAFELAENAWLAIGDRPRALTARVGRGEELYSAAAYARALELTPAIPDANYSYFSARLQNLRCASLNSLGKPLEVGPCYEGLLAAYRRLDERSELASALQNYASFQANQGSPKKAEELARQALEMASGPYAPMTRGRLRLMLADIALRQGRVAESLGESEQALAEFANARDNSTRWQANVFLNVASLYAQVGAYDDAYGALSEALRRLSPRDAPTRMAAAASVFADLERATGHRGSATLWKRIAEETYSNLDMTQARDVARASRLEIEVEQDGGAASAPHEFFKKSPDGLPYAPTWELLDATVHLGRGDLEEAREGLDHLQTRSLSLHEQIRLAQLNATYWTKLGDTDRAQGALLETAEGIRTLANRAGSPTLGYVIRRQLLPLRELAFRLLLERSPSLASKAVNSDMAAIWHWLTAISGEMGEQREGEGSANERFDASVATELLAPTAQRKSDFESVARRELISLLATPEKRRTNSPRIFGEISLALVQERLQDNSVLVCYVDGGDRGGILWITRHAATFVATATPDEIRKRSAALRSQLLSSETPIGDIEKTAQALSLDIFGAIQPLGPPHRLYILNDDTLSAVPWAALSWPNHENFLVDTTTVSVVYPGDQRPTHVVHEKQNLHILVAPQQSSADALPHLASADVEHQLIENVLPASTIAITEEVASTRGAVLSALAEAGTWVHVAAHGTAQPARIGYSGIWLEPAGQGAAPTFLSWLDVLGTRSRSDLVVLNACQLGEGGPNLSFAAAVARAGAKQVVSASWAMSDSATAVWVPAFYAALVADPAHDAAAALRAAQLRLRDSRMFRHPFFWAGIQALEYL